LEALTFPHILIVDEDEDDHAFLIDAINELNPRAKLESLFDESEALGYFGSCDSCPDLIFLDLNMSVLSGQDTIKHIKKNGILKDVPIIVLSTVKSETEKQNVLSLGAKEFYSKPDKKIDLLKIVKEVLVKYVQ
jgi:CheY-like chemotaxis protein